MSRIGASLVRYLQTPKPLTPSRLYARTAVISSGTALLTTHSISQSVFYGSALTVFHVATELIENADIGGIREYMSKLTKKAIRRGKP